MTDSAPATKQDLADMHASLQTEMHRGFEGVLSILSHFMNTTSHEFERVHRKIDRNSEDIRNLYSLVDGVSGRLETLENEQSVMGHQLSRTEGWVRQIAQNTGMQLTT